MFLHLLSKSQNTNKRELLRYNPQGTLHNENKTCRAQVSLSTLNLEKIKQKRKYENTRLDRLQQRFFFLSSNVTKKKKRCCAKWRHKNIMVRLGANMENINNTLITLAHVYEMQ